MEELYYHHLNLLNKTESKNNIQDLDLALSYFYLINLLLKSSDHPSLIRSFSLRNCLESLSVKILLERENSSSYLFSLNKESLFSIDVSNQVFPHFQFEYLDIHNLSYHQIVKKYLSIEYQNYYLYFSLLIHPHFYTTKDYLTSNLVNETIINKIDSLLNNEYSFLHKRETILKSDSDQKNLTLELNQDIENKLTSLKPSIYREIIIILRDFLKDLDYLNQFKLEHVDIVFFKSFLEAIAFYFYLSNQDRLTNGLAKELLEEHFKAKKAIYLNQEYGLLNAYELYHEMTIKPLKYSKFKQEFIDNFLGLNILDHKKNETYLTLVLDFIKEANLENKEDIIKGYLISQGLSHSNGLLAKSYNDKFDIDFKTIYKNLMVLLLK